MLSVEAGLMVGRTGAKPPARAQTQQQPNILFILVDNLGYGELVSTAVGQPEARRRRAWINSPIAGSRCLGLARWWRDSPDWVGPSATSLPNVSAMGFLSLL